jgi:hypothetical protein
MDLRNARICVQKFHHDPQLHSYIHRNLVRGKDPVVSAIFMNDLLWSPGDTITISFLPFSPSDAPAWYTLAQVSPSLTKEQMDIERRARAAPSFEDAVKMIVKELVQPAVPKLNLQFVEGQGDVRVRFQKYGGSSSLVGTACKSAPPDQFTVTFGWMDVGTIVHEFSHVLGMLHEHQNPSGGIQWNTDAVYQWAQQTQGWDKETTDVNILDAYPSNEISGSVFDPESVMLYFFPPELTMNDLQVGQNLRYSQTDLMYLAKMYDSTYNPALYSQTKGPSLINANKPTKPAVPSNPEKSAPAPAPKKKAVPIKPKASTPASKTPVVPTAPSSVGPTTSKISPVKLVSGGDQIPSTSTSSSTDPTNSSAPTTPSVADDVSGASQTFNKIFIVSLISSIGLALIFILIVLFA